MSRSEWVEKITTVRHVVGTFGRNRDNPPSLGQIREFVALCEGLPDDTSVTLDKGKLDEGGRHLFTFSLRIVERVASEEDRPISTPDAIDERTGGKQVTGAERIAAERQRQIEQEGWTPEHDAEHINYELLRASVCYVLAAQNPQYWGPGTGNVPSRWPWEDHCWKPSDDPIRNLEKAGALIAAEIDRVREFTNQPTNNPKRRANEHR